MQGQSSPVQVKDSYTVSIPMHVGLSRKYTGVYKVDLPRIIRNYLMGITRKQNKTGVGQCNGTTNTFFWKEKLVV